jgi:hypothetical protein
MQRRLHLGAAMLVAISVVYGATAALAGDSDSRSAAMARQRIRAKLATAMSDGNLSRMEQYAILLDAKDCLSSRELAGLQQTLDRLAANGAESTEGSGSPVIPVGATIEPIPTPAGEAPRKVDTDGGLIEGSPFQDETPDGLPAPDDDEGCPCDSDCCAQAGLLRQGWSTVSMFSTVDAFKGPMDLDNLNGNFGLRFGVNGAIPVSRLMGLGIQGGTSAVLSDFHGTAFTRNESRTQQFITVGLFQRVPIGAGGVGWGFAYDWLNDDYYDVFHFGQWRVKFAVELSPWNEVGGWATIHDHGDSGIAGDPQIGFLNVHFKPLCQGNFYWRHTWLNDISTTGWLGVAEEPGEMIFGADGRVPIGNRIALVSSFQYILPSARGGFLGQSEEFWNVSVGIELVTCGLRQRCTPNRFAPLLPVADNSSFVLRRL